MGVGTVEPIARLRLLHCLGWRYLDGADHRPSKVCGMHISGALFRVAGAYHSVPTGGQMLCALP